MGKIDCHIHREAVVVETDIGAFMRLQQIFLNPDQYFGQIGRQLLDQFVITGEVRLDT